MTTKVDRRSLCALAFTPFLKLLPSRPSGPPEATLCLVARLRTGGKVVTSIVRTWAPGDSERCRLCDRCSAVANTCLIVVNRSVDPGDAWDYAARNLAESSPDVQDDDDE